jgi:hypothetical protein
MYSNISVGKWSRGHFKWRDRKEWGKNQIFNGNDKHYNIFFRASIKSLIFDVSSFDGKCTFFSDVQWTEKTSFRAWQK